MIEDRIIKACENKSMAKIINQISSMEVVVGITYPPKDMFNEDRVSFVITTESMYQVGLSRDDNFIVTGVSSVHSPSVLGIDESIIKLMKLKKIGHTQKESKKWIC